MTYVLGQEINLSMEWDFSYLIDVSGLDSLTSEERQECRELLEIETLVSKNGGPYTDMPPYWTID